MSGKHFNPYPYLGILAWSILALVQVNIMPLFRLHGVIPDLFLPTVVGVALLRGSRRGALWGIVAGLALDLVAHRPLGSSSLILAAMAALAGRWQYIMFHGRFLLAIVLTFSLTWLEYILLIVGRLFTGGQAGAGWPLFTLIFYTALYNSLVILPVFFLLVVWDSFTVKQSLQWG